MADRPAKSQDMMWVNPYLIVKRVKDALAFYEKAFGFSTRMTLPDKHGDIMHAEMTYNDQVMMIGSESVEQNALAPSTIKGSPVSFYVYVKDVDDFFRKATSAGAAAATEPKDQFWGDRTCTVTCPEGYKWTFAQNVADFDPSKVPG